MSRGYEIYAVVLTEALPQPVLSTRSKVVTLRAAAHLRKVLANYSDSNWSSFGLDLRAAVIRQGLFIDKMYKVSEQAQALTPSQ